MVAAGTIDLVVEAGLKSWDIDAAIPVIEGAGGVVTDWRAGRWAATAARLSIAGDERLLTDALVPLALAG